MLPYPLSKPTGRQPSCSSGRFGRIVVLASAALVAVILQTLDASEADAQSTAPPNVILIFADDLGYGDVGCFADDCPFETPHLDRMAGEGVRMTDFYVPTPYCAPSRGTILTGRYPFRHSVVRNPSPDSGASNFGLPPSEVTLAELLKQSGYATAAYGKWHLGHKRQWLPTKQGFDEYLGILYSNDMYPVQLVENETVVEYPVVQATLTQRYTDRAIDFIKRHREQPFFLYLPHAMPHKPLAVSDNYYTPESKENLYADVIAELDASIGRLMASLKELELDENTLVIFTSDNGPWYGGWTGGLRGMKGRTWEGGLRVPMIARMPGTIASGTTIRQPAGTIDLLPTICEMVGIAPPSDRTIDGRSLLPAWKSPERADEGAGSGPRAIYGMQGTQLATIRKGRWKLHVRSPGPPRFFNLSDDELHNWVDPRGPDGVTILAPYEQARPTQHPGLTGGDEPTAMMLFDLEKDSGEQHDVAEQHPDVVAALHEEFLAMKAQVPEFPEPRSDYLFGPREKGQPRQLMRLIGGELRYDKVPASQRHLLAD